ncbi:uncharacterized protein K441DRAFT_660437, partial [Cenococcum geophilum 1.58]|uniref:uncharacterized protein n=1 Tax=Cenococcum geophilum 1.58 TaxID=794803 RepID=UPI00358DED96
MGDVQEQNRVRTEDSLSDMEASPVPTNTRKPAKLALQKQRPPPVGMDAAELNAMNEGLPSTNRGRRIVPVHQSRIADRPPKVGEKDSSLKIKIELDLEVEVEIYARVKGDVTIGL